MDNKVKIVIDMPGYNRRRDGRPWINTIAAWTRGKPHVIWGHYYGDDDGGTLEIETWPESIIQWGQRDYRHPAGTLHNWGIAKPDATLQTVTAKEARAHWRERHPHEHIEPTEAQPDKT